MVDLPRLPTQQTYFLLHTHKGMRLHHTGQIATIRIDTLVYRAAKQPHWRSLLQALRAHTTSAHKNRCYIIWMDSSCAHRCTSFWMRTTQVLHCLQSVPPMDGKTVFLCQKKMTTVHTEDPIQQATIEIVLPYTVLATKPLFCTSCNEGTTVQRPVLDKTLAMVIVPRM